MWHKGLTNCSNTHIMYPKNIPQELCNIHRNSGGNMQYLLSRQRNKMQYKHTSFKVDCKTLICVFTFVTFASKLSCKLLAHKTLSFSRRNGIRIFKSTGAEPAHKERPVYSNLPVLCSLWICYRWEQLKHLTSVFLMSLFFLLGAQTSYSSLFFYPHNNPVR